MLKRQAIKEQLEEAEDILYVVRKALLNLPDSFEVNAALNCCTMAINATEETRTWL